MCSQWRRHVVPGNRMLNKRGGIILRDVFEVLEEMIVHIPNGRRSLISIYFIWTVGDAVEKDRMTFEFTF